VIVMMIDAVPAESSAGHRAGAVTARAVPSRSVTSGRAASRSREASTWIVVAELKFGRRTLTDERRAWLAAFAAVGADAHVWHDRDYLNPIAAILR
jgi:hypothetical protein